MVSGVADHWTKSPMVPEPWALPNPVLVMRLATLNELTRSADSHPPTSSPEAKAAVMPAVAATKINR